MSKQQKILGYLESRPSATGKELCLYLDISRQALNIHLKSLIASGQVIKSGSTRNARYYSPAHAPAPVVFSRRLALTGLDESHVYEQAAMALNLRSALRDNVTSIVHYAFTEMLNNAIDHSKTDRGEVLVRLEAGRIFFRVLDHGIGVFQSIASKFGLDDEYAAMVELIKGKTTTMPEAHSGEGLFFTSKAADRFLLRSHRIQLEWSRQFDDIFVSEKNFISGTTVEFTIQRDARQLLEDIFSEFAPAHYDYQFQKTKVHVKLLKSEYVSRSEARRLVTNLEKFREIILDFKGVKSVGQGFADELFRVFANRYPDIRIESKNVTPSIGAMFRHVDQKQDRILDDPAADRK